MITTKNKYVKKTENVVFVSFAVYETDLIFWQTE